MEKEKKQLGVAFIVVLVAIVMVSAIGIIAMIACRSSFVRDSIKLES